MFFINRLSELDSLQVMAGGRPGVEGASSFAAPAPADRGDRPLHERLVAAEVDERSIPSLASGCVRAALDWCWSDLGLERGLVLAWFDSRAAPKTMGLFSPDGPTIWLSNALADDAIEASATVVHEARHYYQHMMGGCGSEAADEADAKAYTAHFRRTRRLSTTQWQTLCLPA